METTHNPPLPIGHFLHHPIMRPLLLLLTIWYQTTITYATAAGQETLIGIRGPDFIILGADSALSSRSSLALTASNMDKILLLVDPMNTGACKDKVLPRRMYQQQTILAAAAGDPADADRLLSLLAAHCAIREYENGVGCDVEYVYCDEEEERDSTTKMRSEVNYSNLDESGLNAEQVAFLARGEIAAGLRSAQRVQVCLLIAGLCLVDGARKDRTGIDLDSNSDTSNMHRLEPRLFWLDEYGSLQNIRYGAHGFGANFALSILDQGYREDITRDDAVQLICDCFRQLRQRYVINSPQSPCVKCLSVDGCDLIPVQI